MDDAIAQDNEYCEHHMIQRGSSDNIRTFSGRSLFGSQPTHPRMVHRTLPNFLAGLLLLLLLPGCYISSKGQAKYYERAKRAPFEAVIVPGVPFEGGQWSYVMQMRVHWAVHLYQQGLAKNLVFSGAAVYSPYVEAKIMALYAEQLGVPRANILLETQAEHSTENLFNGFEVARDRGLKGRIGFASDPFQTALLRGLAKRMERELHADIDPVPVVFTELNVANLSTPSIDPSSAFVPGFVSIKEREGFFKRILGTSGAHLDWDRARAENAQGRVPEGNMR